MTANADLLPQDRANIVPEVSTARDETLVSALLALTHYVHDTPEGPRKDRVRYERELVRAEVLRRMGDQR